MDSSPLHNMFTVAEFFISHPSDTGVRCMAALTDRCLNIGRWRCQGSPRLAGVTQSYLSTFFELLVSFWNMSQSVCV